MRRNSLKHNILFVSVISAFLLYGSRNGNHVVNKDIRNTKHINYVRSDVCEVLKLLRKQYIVKVKPKEVIVNQENLFIVTAYDLSFKSCGKSRSSKGYGITSSGYDLRGHTIDSAKTISTDPMVIQTGSKVRLTFKDSKYSRYDGIYISRDTGSKILKNRIDLFVGDNIWTSKQIRQFGITQAYVEIIKD